jgi:hypothetical protein
MRHRSGLTLVEVLVAIFVMGIGLIALLTLFPIGILRFAQAIRDEKCASAARNAHAISLLHNIRMDPVVTASTAIDDPVAPIPDLFFNPFPLQLNGQAGLPNADPFGESYPIFVDPEGFYAGQLPAQTHWVGGQPPNFGGYLRRRDASFIRGATAAATNTNVKRWFTLWDDFNYESTSTNPLSGPGTPKVIASIPPAPPPIERTTRYEWAYLFRRPQASDPSIVDCSIVIFEARPKLVLNEQINTSYFDPIKNTITIPYTIAPPQIRPGGWILDNSLRLRGPAGPTQTGSAHAFFYRVVATDTLLVGGNQYLRCEVQTPLRGFPMPAPAAMIPDPSDPSVPPRQVWQGTTIIMEGIAEVIERGPVRMP